MASSQTFTLNIKAVANMQDVISNIQNIQSALSKLKMPDGLKTSFSKTFDGLEKETARYQQLLQKGFKTKGDASAFTKSGDNILRLYDELVSKINSIDDSALKNMFKDLGTEEISRLKQELNGLQESLKSKINGKQFASSFKTDLQGLRDNLKKTKEDASELASKLQKSTFNTFTKNLSEGRLDLAANNLKSIREQIEQLGQGKNDELLDWLQRLETAFNNLKSSDDIQNTVNQLEQIKGKLTGAEAQVIQDMINGFKQFQGAVADSNKEVETLVTNEQQAATNAATFNKELDQVKSRIQYFLGLNNAINLVKRAIRGAVETIKDLDKAMTETAVVTDFTVSDMWKQLPEYTKRANELGVTTQAAYEAATLYYQQGLNNEEVNALSVETLKMARIAGLDAAEATDRMTNALRGFNMVLDEQSAQRVDDVYSELAANTASNVDEISTAMTKVASLAHSANMEFETTAAFLAQIIETTRESAETAGTALKTVVARFSEVKKLVDTNQLKGQDEEGQVVDVNKVSAALRTAGIDLNKYFLGEVGLDDIFIELASKWDSLTSVQQRYIATQAAGSRQQSRFIALMQDYARTQELVGKAYNAEGASARQFEKTQESLESKLNRLKNAWNEFLMGLTNNVMVKTFVDALTGLLNLVNGLTSAFGDGVGSILKWVAALSALSGLRFLFADGGLASKAIGGLFSNNIFGTALGKLFGINNVGKTNIQGPLTSQGQAPKGPTLISGISGIGKSLWGGAQNLGALFYGGSWGTGAGLSGSAGLTAGLTGIGAALGAVAVAIGAVYTGYQAWLNLSPKGQLKNAQNYAVAMEDTASATAKNVTQLKKVVTQTKEYDTAVKNATTTQERQQAISERNDYITSLLEQNSEYAKYLETTFENGQMVLKLSVDASELDAAIKGADFAQAGSDFASAIVANRQANILSRKLQGVDLTTGQITTTNEYGEQFSRILTNQERAQYTLYQSQLENYQAQFENYTQKAFGDLIDTNLVSDNAANLMSQALAEGFDETSLPTGSGWWRSRAHWQNEYRTAYGIEADSNMKTADIYRAVRMYQNAEAQGAQTQELTDLLTKNVNKDQVESLLEAYLGEGILNTKNLIAENVNNEDELFKLFGLDTGSEKVGQALIDLAKVLNKTTDEVREQIRERVKQRKKEQAQNQYATTTQMLQGGVSATNVARYLKLPELADQELFQSLYSSIDPSYISDNLVNGLLDGLESDGEEFTNWFKSIDLSNPIQAFDKLTSAANNGKGAVQTVATELLNVGNQSKQFSASSQLTYLTLSEGYDSLSESLGKFIEENGSISSSNILELAESNSDLNTMLENNVMSAKALAVALQGLETNDLEIWELSDSIIAALNAMDDLDGEVASIIDELNDFDPGYDENDIVSFINTVLENATENIEKGATGNNAMGNYMRKIFGDFEYTGPEGGYGAAYEAWLNNNVQWLEANKENMFSAWSNFASGLDQHMLGAAEVYEKDGEIIINANKMTTDQLIQAMVETGKVTETQARMMIADFKNYSSDFAYEMAQNDLPNAIQAWADALPEINGKKIYDESEIQTLADLFGVKADKIQAAVNELSKSGAQFSSIKWTNEAGERTAQSILNAWDEIGTNLTTNGIFDYNKIKQAYMDIGLPQMFEEDFNKIASEGTQFSAQLFGETVPISVEQGQTAGEAYAQAFQEAANTDLAGKLSDAIKTAFGEGFDIIVNTDEGVGQLEILQTKISDVQSDLTTLDGSSASPDIKADDYASSVINGVLSKLQRLDGTSATTYVYTVEKTIGGATAKGGIVQSHASGSANRKVSPGISLTGEEGPEIVWNKDKGYAYITGKSHPEFQNLQPGDRIFNAPETRKILQGAAIGGTVPSFAKGYGGVTKTPSGGGGGGGSGGSDKDKTPEEWKNELDWLYNLMEDIAELERDQKVIEEQYEDLLQDQSKTGKDLYNLLIKQLGNLYTQLNHQTFALEKREQEMREFMDTTNDQDQYLWYNWQDRTLEIDWDAIDQIQDEEQYKHVKELVDEAEGIQDKIDDADDAIMDITNQIQELENIWRDTFTDFENRVYDAVVKSYQAVIDKYSELNDTLNNSNSQILDSLQKQISLQRQIRDNTKTEEEIGNDEARLAYLQRDTSGGNDLAALQLQKELADQRQNYEDSLVDQAINRLQEDNNAAAQQRQQQIDIMQAQLDYQSQNGEFNEYIRELLTTAMGAEGELLTNSDLMSLLKEQENWSAMSDVSQQVWEEELNGTFKEVAAFLLKQNAEENGTFYTALTAAVSSVSTAIGSYSQAMVKLGNQVASAVSSGGGGGGGGGGGSTNYTKSSQSSSWDPKTAVKNTVAISLKKTTATKSSGCFAPGTQILMQDNTKKSIEDIKIGEIVIAYDEINHLFIPKTVTKSYVHHNTPVMVRLHFTNLETLDLTPGHPLYSTNGWKSLDLENSLYEHDTVATLLQIGDIIIGINGNKVVEQIEWLDIGFNYDSYNIEVEDCHTFLANGLVAHNAKKFATGGLANYTGLAWLDGTPSEPEYVLNARQTDAFLKLADVLPNMMNTSTTGDTNTFGSTYFNFSVNLDSVSPDYDVDRMVTLVKEKLYDSGTYRNINSLSFLR